jgi:xylose dehydrogenase (NAD/NADP)
VPGDAVRFGVLAPTSLVARLAVVPAIVASAACQLVAVASRSAPAGSVAGVPPEVRWSSAYEDVVADDQVEAVYIPLPNALHREWAERAAEAGKHVLCEKPLAMTASDAAAMADRCADAGVVLMEAYMTPFHPRSRAVQALLEEGAIGEFLFGSAAFTGRLSRPDDHRWQPEMGGGSLLDVGIYCLAPLLVGAGVAPASAGEEAQVRSAVGVRHAAGAGVDASFSGFLEFAGGTSASFECSFEAPERQLLELVGSEAALAVDRAFTPSHDDRVIAVRRQDGSVDEVTTDGADPYLAMVEHFCEVVRGRAEQERPPAHSVALARLVDRLAASAAPSDHEGERRGTHGEDG